MAKSLRIIRIVAFIIITIQIALVAAFSIIYFPNFFNAREYVSVNYVALGFVVLLFLNAMFLWIVIIRVNAIRNKSDLNAAQIVGNDVQEAYRFAMIGLVVTDENDVILWTSDLFKDRHIEIVDENILTVYPSLVDLKSAASNTIEKIVINSRNYEVKYISEAGLWIFKDTTELESIYKYSREQAPVVGLLSIDNFADVIRAEDDFNDVVTKLKNSIFNYCKEYGILLRRHRDDTYLLLCNYESFTQMQKNRFSILDIARDISREEETPLTLSIGIAHGFPDVVKLNEMAASALDIAMSRGGDQVVVSAYGHDMEFFGGKSKAQETRNRVKTRVLADSLISLIKVAPKVLVMGHKDMDMDALGACLGIKAICERLDISCRIVVDFKITENKTRGALLTQFSKDELQNIIISPGEAQSSLTPDMIVVVVDVHTPAMVMDPILLEKAVKVVVIDHHRRAEDYIDAPVFNHIDSSASSASEIITEFIRFSSISPRIEIPPTYATIMLAGIFLDTSYFKSKQTGVRTFEAASILKEFGADNAISDDLLKDDFEEYRTVNQLIADVKTPQYGVVYAHGDSRMICDAATIAKAANTCLTMKGIHCSIVFAQTSPTSVRMSFRSDGMINVQIIAEKMGGGGHFTSAAAVFDGMTIEAVEQKLLDILETYLDDARADNKGRKE
ncbi:MAG: hypothetical protein E7181_01490 [Erysipelotrichaceae bacterium]|nr:hypothetical protein [Erysipelotrichaceae bacterium]